MASSAASPSSSKSDDERRQDGDRDTRDPAASSSAAAAAAQTHAEWAASMQAYYAAAAAAAGGHPYAWPPPQQQQQQHLMAAYGAPVPFPLYHPGAYYAHASMAASVPPMAGCAVPSAAAEGKSKRKTSGGPSGEDSSGSGDGGSEDSSERRDDADEKGLSPAKWRKLGHPDIEGETSQAAAMSEQNPVKAAPNLNIGMDIWSNSTMAAMPSGQVEVNAGTHLRRDKALSQMDERELKRERRKQSNRESARRSRLRKQQECEELSQKVTELTAVNSTLMTELDKLKKDCEDMEAENSQLMDEMVQSEGSSVIATLSVKIDTSKDRHGSSSQLNKHTNDDSKG
ncbi:DNA-binding protein EMBP-1 isoform X1 [Oryza sativa Japonica Group]|uniref:DNA-binding protein EMBP-1 isoform X1 n=1 Tax=Oryza sativa subsp. japonica TaxID=39947 RepID=UPI000775578E|nr:DNA-binding protein EMBP-1 isoform X2 [Oryza sativa Japonica Group]